MQGRNRFNSMKIKFVRNESEFPCVLCSIDLLSFSIAAQELALLNDPEITFLNDEMVPARRNEFIAGRLVAKNALHELSPQHLPKDWTLHRGVFSQPVVEGPEAFNICLSHTKNTVVAIAYPQAHPVGVDLEMIEQGPNSDLIFEHCTDLEKKLAIDVFGNRDLAALKLWTSKESLSKILHTGLMTNFTLFELSAIKGAEKEWNSTFLHFPQYRSQSWQGKSQFLTLSYPANSVLSKEPSEWRNWSSQFL
jgi:4'-phosphopantetheinyl transferase EntD